MDKIKNHYAQLERQFPCCKEIQPELFDEVCQCILILTEVSNKIQIPIEELVEFCYRTKEKVDRMNEMEERYKNEQRRNSLL